MKKKHTSKGEELISLRARRGIDLTYCSISSGGSDRHPMVKQPDEVVNLVTLDLDPDDPQAESLAQGRWI